LRIQVKSPDARSDCDERHRSRVVYYTAKIFEDSHKTNQKLKGFQVSAKKFIIPYNVLKAPHTNYRDQKEILILNINV
jgi:hypothetical protein